jgi:hypothetical protein
MATVMSHWPQNGRDSGGGTARTIPRRQCRRCRRGAASGELAALLTDAAVAAIESGEESINERTLRLAPYAGPAERRRLFERELA